MRRQGPSDRVNKSQKPPSKLRILIAHHEESSRYGLRQLLENPDWEICGEAIDGVQTVEKAEQLRPDILIMDTALMELNGLATTRQILQRNPLQKILILTKHGSKVLIQNCFRAGVRGFVLSNRDRASDIIKAVRALKRNRTFFTENTAIIIKDSAQSLRGKRSPTVE